MATAQNLLIFPQNCLYLKTKFRDLSFLFNRLLGSEALHLLSKFNQILWYAIFLNTYILLQNFHAKEFL